MTLGETLQALQPCTACGPASLFQGEKGWKGAHICWWSQGYNTALTKPQASTPISFLMSIPFSDHFC